MIGRQSEWPRYACLGQRVLLAWLLLGWSGGHVGWAQTTQLLDGIAAIVNDEIITISEVREAILLDAEELQQRYNDAALREKITALYQPALQNLIDVRLQLERARKLNLQVSEEDVSYQIEGLKKQNQISDAQLAQMLQSRGLSLEAYRQQVREGLLLAKVVNADVRSRLVVLDTELQEAYTQQRDRYSVPGEMTVSHIFFLLAAKAPSSEEARVRHKAAKVLQELRDGGDFAALARQYSEGPSAKKDGLLGTFRTGELLPGFEQVAVDLKLGEISELVRTRVGLHIIRVEARKDGGYKPFDEVQEDLKVALLRTKTERKYDEWLETLRQSAYVKILYEG
ncbi:Chaperone SurA [Candidatus Entotheonellaceae bacterium PAL068K]